MPTRTSFRGVGGSSTAGCAGILDVPMYFQGTSSMGSGVRIAEA